MHSAKQKNNKRKPRKNIVGKKEIILLLIILLLTGLIYFDSLKNDFINLDDSEYVINNHSVREISLSNVTTVFTSFNKGDYLPLTMISYMIDYEIGRGSSYNFHFTNLAFHLFNTILVFIFSLLLFQQKEIGLISALIFAIHPMHSESVLWIAERKDVLFTFFYIASLIYYLLFIKKQNNLKYYFISILLFLLSLLSKSAAVTLPLLLFLIDYYLSLGFKKKNILEKLPYLFLSLIFGIITIISKFNIPKTFADDLTPLYSLFERSLLVSYNIMFYLVKFFIPYHLSFFHVYPQRINGYLPVEYYAAPLGIILILLFTFFLSGKYKKDLIFGLLFFLIPLILILKILPFAGQLVAERYTYIPYLGISFIIAKIYCSEIGEKFIFSINIKKIIFLLLISASLLFCYLTNLRIHVWKNSELLYSDVIEKQPFAVEGYHGRGFARMKNLGDYSGAIEDFSKAIQIDSTFAEGYNSRGWAKYKMNKSQSALADLNKAISLNSIFFNAYNNRGIVKKNLGDYNGALEDYNKAIGINPDYPNAYFNRALLRLVIQDKLNACKDFEKATSLGHPDAKEYLIKYCK